MAGRGRYVSTPEQAVKNEILWWLSLQSEKGRCFAWVVKSTGVFDPVKKIYRKDNSKYWVPGVSDICGLWRTKAGPCVPIFIEVKAGKNKPSLEQGAFLMRCQNMGGIAFCAWSLKEVMDRLDPL